MSATTPNLGDDLNATIAAAVNARIEAAVMEALSGDEVMGRFITAALTEKVETDRYSRAPAKTFLVHTVHQAIQAATRQAVERLMEEEHDRIETEIKKAIRRNLPALADRLVSGLSLARYSIGVTIHDGSD